METTGNAGDERDHAGVFEWLGHERAHADDEQPPIDAPLPHDWITPASTHARLDPLTVQGVINRVLVLVFCLIAVGAAFETVSALSSSHVPQATAVTPSPLQPVRITATSAPRPKPAKTTPTTTPVAVTTTPTSAAPAVTTPPQTVPVQTTQITSTPRTTPQTIPAPVVTTPRTTPPTTPVQAVAVPSSPTTQPSGPTDTIAVPYTPTPSTPTP